MNQKFKNRLRILNSISVNEDAKFVVYWMQINRRFEYNYALEYAVELANELKKPLLIYEGLSSSYPWASDRFHSFILDGMIEHEMLSKKEKFNYFNYVEKESNDGKGLIYDLVRDASVLVSDDYPVFIINEHNKRVASKIKIPFHVVDSNGIIPFSKTQKAPFTAFHFRKIIQKEFAECYHLFPVMKPLDLLENKEPIQLENEFLNKFHSVNLSQISVEELISQISIDHSVKRINEKGTREEALKRYKDFISKKIYSYNGKRNHPDQLATSRMSGYLHFGKISVYDMIEMILINYKSNWNPHLLSYQNGQSGNFYQLPESIESFFDELITWREVGFHYAHHTQNYDSYDSLPDWAKKTLEDHESDKREFIYSLDEFENAKTHDAIWNAAQRELVMEGRIHNYLRMLWGKKILEWTPNAKVALDIMIHLNNKYAIDGRDPNSYSGIFWVLGRFDRAWAERPIFGKIRYMSSEQTKKKVELKNYLKKYSRF